MRKRVWLAIGVLAVLASPGQGGAAPEREVEGKASAFEREASDWETTLARAEADRENAEQWARSKKATAAAVARMSVQLADQVAEAERAVAEKKARVAELARASGRRKGRGMVLHYRFGARGEWGTGAAVRDWSGKGHNGRVEGDGLEVVKGMGKRGKAVRFDGKGDFIRVPRDGALEPEEVTVAAWVRMREEYGEGGGGTIVFKWNGADKNDEGYCLDIQPNRTVRATMAGGRGELTRVQPGFPMDAGVWHHVALTFAPGDMRMYVDGWLAGKGECPGAAEYDRTADLLVGARGRGKEDPDRFGAFDLAELKVWNRTLLPEEIEELYNKRAGEPEVGKTDSTRRGATVAVNYPPVRRRGRGASAHAVRNAESEDGGKQGKGAVARFAFGRDGEWGPGAVVRDWSGKGHDGTVEGNGLERVRGMSPKGRAVRFDGKGDFIRVPKDAVAGAEALTVAAWVRVREGDEEGESGTIVYKRNTSFHDNEGFCLEIFPDFRLKGTVANRDSRGQCQVFSSAAMAKGLWHHVAMTYEPGRARLYLDGALAGSGSVPESLDLHPGADWLVGVRDHAQYPLSRFGMFDLADFTMWDEALDGERVAALYRERAGWKGVAKPEDNRAPAGDCPVSQGVGRVPTVRPPRVFPEWKPDGVKGTEWLAELRELVAQGRRDRAASPEFLGALEGLVEKYGGTEGGCVGKPSDQLPLKPEFRGPGMPAGWSAVDPTVWRFGDGEARQVESKANTRYALFYGPGMAWKDYEVTLRFESDKWFPPPANSGAELYVRYKRVDDAFRLDWNGNGYLSVISCEAGGRERAIARVPVGAETIRDGKPWTVRVRGDEIVVEHEGKRQLEVHDPMHREGTVGLESIHIPVKFGGLEVR